MNLKQLLSQNGTGAPVEFNFDLIQERVTTDGQTTNIVFVLATNPIAKVAKVMARGGIKVLNDVAEVTCSLEDLKPFMEDENVLTINDDLSGRLKLDPDYIKNVLKLEKTFKFDIATTSSKVWIVPTDNDLNKRGQEYGKKQNEATANELNDTIAKLKARQKINNDNVEIPADAVLETAGA